MREGQSGEYKVENGAELFSSLQMEKKFVKLKGACRKKLIIQFTIRSTLVDALKLKMKEEMNFSL